MQTYGRKSNDNTWWIALVAAALLFWTNPEREAYVEYAAKAHEGQIRELCRETGAIGSWVCDSILRSPWVHEAVRDHIDGHSQRNDYWLFSVYRTNLFMLHRRYVTLGILGCFIDLRDTETAAVLR